MWNYCFYGKDIFLSRSLTFGITYIRKEENRKKGFYIQDLLLKIKTIVQDA